MVRKDGKKSVSLKDMAKELGVSIPSVSRALNDSPEVSQALKEKVLRLAQEWDYRPNPFAKSLKHGAPKLIGVLVPDFTRHFHSTVISGIEAVASENGYNVICSNSHECYLDEKQGLESLVSLHVDGIIACISQDTVDYSHFERLHTLNVPVVFFARTCLGELFSSVISDGVEGAYSATKHLLQQGCKNIAFIGGPNHLDMTKRRKHGYLEALKEAGIEIRKELVKCDTLELLSAYNSVRELLSQENRPDAILAANDTLLYGTLKAIKDMKLRIPDDVALIGFSDNPDVEYITPPISSISDHARLVGRTACNMLMDIIAHGTTRPKQEVIPMKLNLRESSQLKDI